MYNCLLVYFLLHFARSDFKKEICDVLREQKEKRDIERETLYLMNLMNLMNMIFGR